MKKTLRLLAFSTLTLFAISASAQGIDDLMRPEKWHGDGNAPVSNGEKIRFNEGMPTKQELEISVGNSGIYDIAIECNANSVSSKCRIYAKGTNYSVCSAEVPLARGQKNVKVYLRGVGTTDGKVKIGIESDGMHSVEIGKTEIKKTDKPYKFLQGGDITMLHYVLDRGGNYFDADGNMLYNQNDTREEKAQAVLDYMSRRGFNFVRIRNSNNPGPQSTDASGKYCFLEGYQDTEDCLRLAREAKKAGMEIQYTFNLSDYWSNGEC
ncbi:MAG: glycosyl hydrolase 53 family protein, partial [Paludibacteraceae bacterium]|nr:glycosyl hydrolase 53 family protein [Paludibacteraceae bacterium]